MIRKAPYFKTHAGKTALQILERATIAQMKGGNFEIVTPDFPGCILFADENDDLVVDGEGGTVGRMLCCDAAREKLLALNDAFETAMTTANPHYGQ